MDYKQVKVLLEKYWEGETSLKEEKTIRQYFASGDIAEDLEPYKSLFDFFETEQLMVLPKEIQLPDLIEERAPAKIRRFNFIRTVAAALLIAFGIFFIYQNQRTKVDETMLVALDTYDNPEMAYEEVKKALFYLGGKMNKGVSTASASLDKMKALDELLN